VLAIAYPSAWQHPGIAWIAGVPLLAIGTFLLRRERVWRWVFLVLQAEILIDAWLTGAWSPLGSTGRAAVVASVIFVIGGDLRFFYLVERQRGAAAPGLRPTLRALAIAGPVSLVVPVATAVLAWSGRRLYLVYEVGLFVVALFFARIRAPQEPGLARYVRRLAGLVCTQYLIWATADALIIYSGEAEGGTWLAELGWALRIVANAMYYVLFVPVATWKTPAGSRA
jgi:hypothetical protein